MSHSFSLTMTRPHERFGLVQPLARQLAQHGSLGWYAALWALALVFGFTYVSFMITSSAKGFELRDAERRVERLRTEARALETTVAQQSSIQQLSDRAHAIGFVPVNRIASVNVAGHSYVFAR